MSTFQVENAALDLGGKTMMVLVWKLHPKTTVQEELMAPGVFGVFSQLSQLFTASGDSLFRLEL